MFKEKENVKKTEDMLMEVGQLSDKELESVVGGKQSEKEKPPKEENIPYVEPDKM